MQSTPSVSIASTKSHHCLPVSSPFAVNRKYKQVPAIIVQALQSDLADKDPWAPVTRTSSRSCLAFDQHHALIPYEQAWTWQRDQIKSMTALPSDNLTDKYHGKDRLVILQHPPVYTLGTGSTEDNVLTDAQGLGIQVIRTERGGEVTYHGPGQLVLYPLLHLQHHKQDLHWYMRGLEEVIIMALDEVSGIKAGRMPGLTGVWVDGQKVAAIGVRAKKWVTYHGVALNVVPDLRPFQAIIPCGIGDRPVTSVQRILAGQQGVMGGTLQQHEQLQQRQNNQSISAGGMNMHSSTGGNNNPSLTSDSLKSHVGSGNQVFLSKENLLLEGTEEERTLLTEYSYAVLDAFEYVFNVQLERSSIPIQAESQ